MHNNIDIVLSASTPVEMDTAIPIIDKLNMMNITWVLLVDDYHLIDKYKNRINLNNVYFFLDINFIRLLMSVKPKIYCKFHEKSFLSLLLSTFFIKNGVSVFYIPHGIISNNNNSLIKKYRIWRNNSFVSIQQYIKLGFKLKISYLLFINIVHVIIFNHCNLMNYSLVSDDNIKNILIQRGVPDDRIFITGNPCYEINRKEIANDIISNKNNEYEVDNKKIIVFFSQPFVEDNILTTDEWNKIINIIINLTIIFNIFIYIKIHPRENDDKYAHIQDTNITVIEKSTPLSVLFRSTDIVLTINSSAGYESALLGIPTVSFCPSDIEINPLLINDKMITAHSESDLFECINHLLNSLNGIKKFEESNIDACQNIINCFEQLVNTRGISLELI